MYKVVKQLGFNLALGEPVPIDNSIYIPLTEEEKLLSAEEKREREAQRKLEEERNFDEAVKAAVKASLEEREACLEKKRSEILEEAHMIAKAVTSEAKESAAGMIEKAVMECDRLHEQAKKEGYDEGHAAGHAESMEKCRKYIDGIAMLMGEINSRKEAYYISNEKELKDTVFLMVQKIVKAELEVNPAVIENIISDAAKGYRNSDYIKISVSDGEITQKIKTDKKFAEKLIPFIKDVEFEILHDADEGTIILDDDQNIVDASIPTQLDFLKEILKNTRGEDA